MKFNKLVLIALTIFPLLFMGSAYGKEFSKKEMKVFKKNYTAQLSKSKKMLSEGKRVAILGNTLIFRTQAKKSASSSNKDAKWTKAAGIAQLNGVPDSIFQEITEEYNAMVIKRLTALGVEIVPISEMQKAKSFNKLVGEAKAGDGSVWEDSKKNWGVSKNAIPKGQYPVWYNHFKPFGAHAKLPKELKAALYNSFVHVNFAKIVASVSAKEGKYGNGTAIFTNREASVVPRVFVDARTLTTIAQPPKAYANINIVVDKWGDSFGREDKIGAESTINYAKSSRACSDCKLGFTSKSFINEGNVQIVAIEADPELYKKAALEALSAHLDRVFALYASK